jgi:hypothetical protein
MPIVVILGIPIGLFVWLLIFSHYGMSDEEIKERGHV